MFDYNPNAMEDVERVRARRRAEVGTPEHLFSTNINTLPDYAWDAFFGAIQRKADDVYDAGGRFNVDLVGRRGMSGIGNLRAQNLTTGGTTYDPRRDAMSGLMRATRGY